MSRRNYGGPAFDATSDGRPLKVLTMGDEFTRPHSSLGYMPPAVFAAALINPEPSLRVDH